METHAFGFRLQANAPEGLKAISYRYSKCVRLSAPGPAGAEGREICDQTIDEICWREEVSMKRETWKLFGAAAVAAAIGVVGISGLAFAQDQKKMVTVVKIAGIPWFNALEKA